MRTKQIRAVEPSAVACEKCVHIESIDQVLPERRRFSSNLEAFEAAIGHCPCECTIICTIGALVLSGYHAYNNEQRQHIADLVDRRAVAIRSPFRYPAFYAMADRIGNILERVNDAERATRNALHN